MEYNANIFSFFRKESLYYAAFRCFYLPIKHLYYVLLVLYSAIQLVH